MTLISVITPTWQRHHLLMNRCLPSVFTQTYPCVEHVVVSDGPDRVVAALLAGDLWRRPRKTRPLVFDALPEHDEHPQNVGSLARNRGLELATGELVAYLDDDNAYRSHHLALLAEALTANPEADFAYSRMQVYPAGGEIGSSPPMCGCIDSSLIMHRRAAVERFGGWPPPSVYEIDWAFVASWLQAGARWVFIDEVTVDYYRKPAGNDGWG